MDIEKRLEEIEATLDKIDIEIRDLQAWILAPRCLTIRCCFPSSTYNILGNGIFLKALWAHPRSDCHMSGMCH